MGNYYIYLLKVIICLILSPLRWKNKANSFTNFIFILSPWWWRHRALNFSSLGLHELLLLLLTFFFWPPWFCFPAEFKLQRKNAPANIRKIAEKFLLNQTGSLIFLFLFLYFFERFFISLLKSLSKMWGFFFFFFFK